MMLKPLRFEARGRTVVRIREGIQGEHTTIICHCVDEDWAAEVAEGMNNSGWREQCARSERSGGSHGL